MKALRFLADGTDQIDYGTGIPGGLSTWTMIFWTYVRSVGTPSGADNGYLQFRNTDGNNNINTFMWQPGSLDGRIECSIGRATINGVWHTLGVSNAPVRGAFNFFAFTLDDAATPRQHGYMGLLNRAPSEPGHTNVEGTGALGDEGAANLNVGNNSTPNNRWPGAVSLFSHWSRVLTLAEITEQWKRARPTAGCEHFSYLGQQGVGSVLDYSGHGRHGLVLGALPDIGPPVPYFWERNRRRPVSLNAVTDNTQRIFFWPHRGLHTLFPYPTGSGFDDEGKRQMLGLYPHLAQAAVGPRPGSLLTLGVGR